MMESAEHEMLRSLGIAVMPPRHAEPRHSQSQDDPNTENNSVVTWPRVSAKCDYLSAARFEDVLTIDVSISKLGTSSVTYSFRFHRSDQNRDNQSKEQVIAVGTIVAVCCQLDDSGLTKIPLSDAHREKLKAHAVPANA
ncbi:Thioesterase superfamily protein [Rubripirellula obstinata]|uniref:Thioesterase superfamily protein n=2 Tax=Rubripirellula obstinata TaxID=406547 RepID=A0A5B1CDN2_9BACT|nr:Thioesterase superfamily protein [Rubripirellula obstinata]